MPTFCFCEQREDIFVIHMQMITALAHSVPDVINVIDGEKL